MKRNAKLKRRDQERNKKKRKKIEKRKREELTEKIKKLENRMEILEQKNPSRWND